MRFLFGCYATSLHLQVFQRISLKERKKEEKNTVNLIRLIQKQETRSTYLTL